MTRKVGPPELLDEEPESRRVSTGVRRRPSPYLGVYSGGVASVLFLLRSLSVLLIRFSS